MAWRLPFGLAHPVDAATWTIVEVASCSGQATVRVPWYVIERPPPVRVMSFVCGTSAIDGLLMWIGQSVVVICTVDKSSGGFVPYQKLVNAVTSGLAWDLKYIRNQCGLTLEDVCLKLKWQQSKLSRMEGGQQCISEADLASVLVMYEVTGKERQRLLHLSERQDDPGRWENSPELSEESRTLMRLEPEANSIVDVETLLVPGLVQTTDYAEAIMKAANLRPEQIVARVKARMARQDILFKDKPPKLDMILDETILRRVVGSHKIMARQLRALLDATERPNVRLRIVPFQQAMDAGLVDGPLYLMDFPRGNSVLHLEYKLSGVFLEDQDKIDICRQDVARLASAALSPAESLDLVAKVAREHDLE
jgi:hypothetical protein